MQSAASGCVKLAAVLVARCMLTHSHCLRLAACLSAALLGAAWLGAPSIGSAGDSLVFGPHDVHSAFHVEKSENKNEVHYAVHVDAACHPQGKTPVFAYWRRLKKGVRVDEPLTGPGVRVYGASNDQTVGNTATGGRVGMYVKALKRLPVDIHVDKAKDGTCQAVPHVAIKGEQARLSYAFLQLGRFGLTVKYVDVWGVRDRDGLKVTEQFR
jgi:hypothetical protein